MFVRLIAFIAFLLLATWGMNAIARRYSLTRQQTRLMLILGVILTVIMVLILLGRLPIHFILAPIGVALTFLVRMLPTVLRLLPLWQMLKGSFPGGQRNNAGHRNKSVIRTEFLNMELNHSSGDMDGQVVKGSFEGRQLSSMTLEELMLLARECGMDQDSIQVMEAYLDRMHNGWRENAGHQQKESHGDDEPVMNRELALEILGLSDGVGKEEVQKAHRRLMQKMHPDRGGSEYLAKKINAARDYLLEHL